MKKSKKEGQKNKKYFEGKGKIKLGKKTKKNINKVQQTQIDSSKKKVNISLIISITAILISGIQLVLTSPFFLDAYNKPSVSVYENYHELSRDGNTVTFVYQILNNGKKPAKNINIRFYSFKKDVIQFIPNEAIKINSDLEDIPIANHSYQIKNLVPNESYYLFIYSDAHELKKNMGLDTLEAGEKYKKPGLFMTPYLEMVKTEQGFADIYRQPYLILSYSQFLDTN